MRDPQPTGVQATDVAGARMLGVLADILDTPHESPLPSLSMRALRAIDQRRRRRACRRRSEPCSRSPGHLSCHVAQHLHAEHPGTGHVRGPDAGRLWVTHLVLLVRSGCGPRGVAALRGHRLMGVVVPARPRDRAGSCGMASNGSASA